MKKIVLIDGNNLMFRSYYATAYSGSIMTNSKGFPTNALYGFASMLNKIINEEKPEYIAVAFDIGINFRKKEFSFYKDGRNKTPEELKMQMPIARDLLKAMGITSLELEPYEADDIIGTLVKKVEEDKDFDATIISSDKDLLQLINFETDIKLLKQTGYIRYNEKSFKEAYGIDPINIIDLKGLMGDSSDNIPGVKGIGEKTALKLLCQYHTLEGIYENIDTIKGSVHEKLVLDKDNAFMSKKIATIYKDVPLEIELENLKYIGPNENLYKLLNELEFTSLIKNIDVPQKEIKYIDVNDEVNIVLNKKVALFIEGTSEKYNQAEFYGASIYDGKYAYYFANKERLIEALKDKEVITYDHKKNLSLLNFEYNLIDDIKISSYLVNYNVKDDIAFLSSQTNDMLISYSDQMKDENIDNIKNNIVHKAIFIYENNDKFLKKIDEEELNDLYRNIELPLEEVLHEMEYNGVIVKKEVLDKQGVDIDLKLEDITNRIYNYAGLTFNIGSPKQLGEVLFETMGLAKGKKNKTGYKTDEATLEKLVDVHPIIPLILEYRNLAKLKSTYIDGLKDYISKDGKIHTIFTQTIARTGRLSSVEPNLQNIPVREELGRKVREAFIPENDVFLSCDYSQIELRILAHVTNCQKMIETFNSDGDIHTKVASDINGCSIDEVTKEMRSKAKSVIFGIVYGISGFGLGENLHISKKEADEFIEKYYCLYPEVKEYMSKTIEDAKINGYVRTIFGRKRVIDEIHNSNFMIRQSGERMAINTPIQGSAADIIKMAMINVYKRFKLENIKSKMVLQVHDELIFDCKNSELDKITNIVREEMENVVNLSVPLKVSHDVGENWYETK